MQLSLFDTLNYYKDFIVDDQDIAWKPSINLVGYDVFYYKGKAMFHIEIYPSQITGHWHFHTRSMSQDYGTGFLTTDVSTSLREAIKEWKMKGSWG